MGSRKAFFVFALFFCLQIIFPARVNAAGGLKRVDTAPERRAPQVLSKDKPKVKGKEAIVRFKAGKSPAELESQKAEREAMGFAARTLNTLILKAKREKTPKELLEKISSKERKLNIIGREDLSENSLLVKSQDKPAGVLVDEFEDLENVEYAEPNYLYYASRVPNDPKYIGEYDPEMGFFWQQWNLKDGLGLERVWDTTTGSDVIVAVLDTGVEAGAYPNVGDAAHPDLRAKVLQGYDFVNNSIYAFDDEGHGSHVASIVAAVSNNGEGVAGISWGAKILPVKVLNQFGEGTAADLAAGIRWAADYSGVKIINMSLGGSFYSQTVVDEINYAYEQKKVLLVAAAGNEKQEGNPVTYPAAYNHVLGVAAVDDERGHASYSNTGSYVDISAVGGDPSGSSDSTTSHWIPGAYWQVVWQPDGSGVVRLGYALMAGTSQAAPHVSGLAALLLSVNSSLTNSDIEQIVADTAIDLGSTGRDDVFGYGLIDPVRAVEAAQRWSQPTLTPQISPTFTPTPSSGPSPTAGQAPTPTPPAGCGADVNCSGEINHQDIVDWRRFWQEGDSRAELNGNGGSNVLDYLLLLTSWL